MSDARQWVIGRAPDCDIVMGQSDVSGRHCRLSRASGAWSVEDLGSSNGTFVNGRRLAPQSPTAVGPGDAVTLGTAPMPWPERPSAAVPRVAKTVLAAPMLDPLTASPRTPVPASRPMPRPAEPPKPAASWLPVAGVLAVGVIFLGGLVALFWSVSEPKEKDREAKKEEPPAPKTGMLIAEDFTD
ncbi:MAG: FHA domain-containing protein, partial [Gemmataceae bacterium]